MDEASGSSRHTEERSERRNIEPGVGTREAAAVHSGPDTVTSSARVLAVPRQISIGRNNNKEDEDTNNTHSSNDRGKISLFGVSGSARPTNSSDAKQNNVTKIDDSGLWNRLESVMVAKQSHVQQVLEEFGIASDVPPDSDSLEEQMWRVVQGELTMQEAMDLV